MVAIRAFLNVAQAELAKSLLDDYGILCEVAHENAHLYGGSPFAMPIQLLVDESDAGQAIRILDGNVEETLDLETPTPAAPLPSGADTRGLLRKDNPWELLAIAALFLLPGIWGLWTKYPVAMTSGPRAPNVLAVMAVFHFLSFISVAFAACLVIAYVYLKWPANVKPKE